MSFNSVIIGLKQIIFDTAKTFANRVQISYTSAGVISFVQVDNAFGGVDTITDSAAQFIAQGFKAADIIIAKGSTSTPSNNGIMFNIVSITAGTITVSSLGRMTNEVGGAGIITIETPLASAVYGIDITDHDSLSGLGDDDHTIYFLVSGVRPLTGNLTVSTYNIVTDTSTGTKIGTAANQKLGFYNQTPVDQPASVADATGAGDVVAQLNYLLARMRELGLIAT